MDLRLVLCTILAFSNYCTGLVFKYHNSTVLTYHNARIECQTNGYELLVLHSEADITEINNFLDTLDRPQHIWIGLDKYQGKSNFTWLTGNLASFNNWEEGEPDGWSYQHCVCIQKTNLRWNSRRCGYKFNFLCGPLSQPINYDEGGLLVQGPFYLFSQNTSIQSISTMKHSYEKKLRCAHLCSIQVECTDFSLSTVDCTLHLNSVNGSEFTLIGTNLWTRRPR
ncbi:hypothetical protein LOTGIDRAFT_153402 [Lottia gigantea]|uniref:C-type lectin domain-containing protein n=1 Tax=Lottia gigantea TaxID=225164 RepID=V4AFN4_LOTGI|nr:hypothetical protein LOTGIDRAFT_153402 [Lottia gigantea]ESO93930.1 hypothetical protein LOTGIDRAFT_153402 [Lottia gigantea]